MTAPEYVAVGKIVKPHGVRGAAMVFPLTEQEERFDPGETLWLSPTPEGRGGAKPVTVTSSRIHKGRRLIEIDRFEDRTQVEQRVGWYLVIPFADAEEARETDEFFIHGLVGHEVRTETGERLGEVTDVLVTEGTPLLELQPEGGGARRLLPFVREFVHAVEDEAVLVTPPAGWEEL
ncbi:MAG: ribosome maturation factor RimM [Gemmatimonadota bacterium]|nr:ribosome maturation factor RimM [Gemmatimonadota bacterium]